MYTFTDMVHKYLYVAELQVFIYVIWDTFTYYIGYI